MVCLAMLLVALLYSLGSVPWCRDGFGVWTWSSVGRCTSQDFSDPYSFTHITHGFLGYWVMIRLARRSTSRWRYAATLTMEVAWELLENSPWVVARYRQQTAALGYLGDSILNSVGDLIFCAAGFILASRLPAKITVGLAVFMEVLLLLTIRDNLLLNVLMLIAPLPAIRDWQLGLGTLLEK